jgi:G3E family GTPase
LAAFRSRPGQVADAAPPIEVTVIGGYLGAGKTTIVNHLLRTSGDRIAVLVNDFGDINIDADLIESADGDTINLANGCICCSLVDGFASALDQILTSPIRPERLVIEASGVGDPKMIGAYGQVPGMVLDAVLTVVDAETVIERSKDRYVGTTVLRQIVGADLVVLNKIDLVSPEQKESVIAWLGDVAPSCSVVESENGRAPIDVLSGVTAATTDQTSRPLRDENSHHHGADVFDRWSTTTPVSLSKMDLERLLRKLPSSVLRLKGFVQLTGTDDSRPTLLNCVGVRWQLSPLNIDPSPPLGLSAVTRGDSDAAEWLQKHMSA